MKTTVAILYNQRHLLPTGKLAMQLLPGSQMQSLSYALKKNIPLGLHMDEMPCQFGSIGTIVDIEDFYALERDGVLTLQLSGTKRYVIEETLKLTNNMQIAQVNILPSWPDQSLDDDALLLSEKLQSMYERFPELGDLHSSPNFENLTWLCQRWLELLPLPVSEKQLLMSANSCSDAAQYLLSLMKELH